MVCERMTFDYNTCFCYFCLSVTKPNKKMHTTDFKLLERTLFFFYLILIGVGLSVPSDGNHGLLSIKTLSFLLTSLFFFLYLINTPLLTERQFKLCFGSFTALTVILCSLIVSVLRDVTPIFSAIDQCKLLIVTITTLLISITLYSRGLIRFTTLLKTALYSNLLYAACKIFLLFLLFLGVIDLKSLITLLNKRLMTLSFGSLSRLQTSVDIATPFLLFFLLKTKTFDLRLSKPFKIGALLIFCLSIILSFSRYLGAVALVALLLYAVTEPWTRRLKIALCSLFLVSLFVFWVGPKTCIDLLHLRFTSFNNSRSDETRKSQSGSLMAEFLKTPYLGKGIGSSAKEIRDKDLPHSYEMQWLAFLMQFGIVGLFFILGGLFFLSAIFFTKPFDGTKVALGVLLQIFLLSGFTNPYLISLTSGIIYSLFYLGGLKLKEQTL